MLKEYRNPWMSNDTVEIVNVLIKHINKLEERIAKLEGQPTPGDAPTLAPKEPPPKEERLTDDDIDWMLGSGRYAQ